MSPLSEKVKRTNLVALMWKRATTSDPHAWELEENGWTLENGQYTIKWFERRQVPEDVCCQIDKDTDEEMSDDEDEMAEYSSSSDEADSDIDDEVTLSSVMDKDIDDNV